MTTTSPRAMTRPLTSRSTGSPAMRCRPTTEPGPRARASPRVIVVRPISTDTSTVTSVRRSSSPGSEETAGAGWRGAKSIGSDTGRSPALLDGDVGEQHVVGLDVGLLEDLLEDALLELLAATALDDPRARHVAERVGDDVAHRGLLGHRPEALGRRGGRLLAAGGRRGRALLDHEGDVDLGELAVGRVDEEVLREDVDLALDLLLRDRRRARQGELVDAAEDDQEDGQGDHEFLFHGIQEPRRGRTIWTRRLRARPCSVVLDPDGSRYARPVAVRRSGLRFMAMRARTTAEARAVDSSQLEG